MKYKLEKGSWYYGGWYNQSSLAIRWKSDGAISKDLKPYMFNTRAEAEFVRGNLDKLLDIVEVP